MPTKNTSASLRSSAVMAVFAFLVLVVHDSVLYPHLGAYGIAELAGLRWLLLVLPVVGTLGLLRGRGAVRWLSGLLWFIFIPYTLYSLLEVRHVAEICRLSTGYFTQHCSAVTWQVLPSLLYGLMGLAVFVYSMTALTVRRSRLATIALITATAFYAAVASVFGIFTRLNVWDVIIAPGSALHFSYLLKDGAFWLNIAMLGIVFSLVSVALIFWHKKSR